MKKETGERMGSNEENRKEGLKADGVPYRVLVVDDSIITRKVVKRILTSEQYEICGEAEDGDQVLDLYKELRPDIITLDMHMSRVDGIVALKQILDFDANARVVMLTGAEEKKNIIRAISLGAKDYVVKPPAPEGLLEKIKNVLQR